MNVDDLIPLRLGALHVLQPETDCGPARWTDEQIIAVGVVMEQAREAGAGQVVMFEELGLGFVHVGIGRASTVQVYPGNALAAFVGIKAWCAKDLWKVRSIVSDAGDYIQVPGFDLAAWNEPHLLPQHASVVCRSLFPLVIEIDKVTDLGPSLDLAFMFRCLDAEELARMHLRLIPPATGD